MKKNISKLLLVLGLSAGLVSCEDFLAEENKTGLTADGYYVTEEGMEALVNSCYLLILYYLNLVFGEFCCLIFRVVA